MKSSIVFIPTVLWLIEQLTLQMMFVSIMKGTERPFRISLSWYIKELNTPEMALAVRIQLYSHGLPLTAPLWLKLPSDKNVFTAMRVWIRRIRFSVHHNKTSAACRRGQFWSCITQKGCGNNLWSNATVVEDHITSLWEVQSVSLPKDTSSFVDQPITIHLRSTEQHLELSLIHIWRCRRGP